MIKAICAHHWKIEIAGNREDGKSLGVCCICGEERLYVNYVGTVEVLDNHLLLNLKVEQSPKPPTVKELAIKAVVEEGATAQDLVDRWNLSRQVAYNYRNLAKSVAP